MKEKIHFERHKAKISAFLCEVFVHGKAGPSTMIEGSNDSVEVQKNFPVAFLSMSYSFPQKTGVFSNSPLHNF